MILWHLLRSGYEHLQETYLVLVMAPLDPPAISWVQCFVSIILCERAGEHAYGGKHAHIHITEARKHPSQVEGPIRQQLVIYTLTPCWLPHTWTHRSLRTLYLGKVDDCVELNPIIVSVVCVCIFGANPNTRTQKHMHRAAEVGEKSQICLHVCFCLPLVQRSHWSADALLEAVMLCVRGSQCDVPSFCHIALL